MTKKSGIRVKCLHCSNVLISNFRHDFKFCSCKSISIDGGSDYLHMSHEPHAVYILIEKEEDLDTPLVGPRDTSDDLTWCNKCEQLVLKSSTELRHTAILEPPGGDTLVVMKDFCKEGCEKKE